MTGIADWFVTCGAGAQAAHTAPTARIFCFPHAGGSPRAFLGWQAGLGDDAEIVGICRPGREHRTAEPAPTMQEFIDGAATAIGTVTEADGRPFYLFGHSLGALVAFEVCRRLAGATAATAATWADQTARRIAPRHFVASGCSAPSLLPSRRVKEIANLTGRQFAEAIGFFGGLAEDVIADEEVRDLLLPGLIADFHMAVGYRYTPGPRLEVPATLVIGRGDPHVKAAQIGPWNDEFSWPPDCRLVDGGHFYFEARPDLATGILQSLVRADQHVELI
jgi:surfactin synthase thioesterase subunit